MKKPSLPANTPETGSTQGVGYPDNGGKGMWLDLENVQVSYADVQFAAFSVA